MAAGVQGLATSASPLTVIEPPGTGFFAGTVVAGGDVAATVVAAATVPPPCVLLGAAVVAVAPIVTLVATVPLSFFLPHDAAISPSPSTVATTIRYLDRCLFRTISPSGIDVRVVVDDVLCCDTHHTPTARHLSQATAVVNDTGPIPLPIVPLLRDHHLTKPHPQRLSPSHPRYAAISARHAAALAEGAPCYVDPDSGLMVFTAAFLADRGYCCDSGCRHCPFVAD